MHSFFFSVEVGMFLVITVDFHYRLASVNTGSLAMSEIMNAIKPIHQRSDSFPSLMEAIATLKQGRHIMVSTRNYLVMNLHKYSQVILLFCYIFALGTFISCNLTFLTNHQLINII